jgi:hypothetical protein
MADKNSFLIRLLAVVIILAVFVFLFVRDVAQQRQVSVPNTCPATGWVDCMPGPGASKSQCQKEYLAWAQASCPDFQGVAY